MGPSDSFLEAVLLQPFLDAVESRIILDNFHDRLFPVLAVRPEIAADVRDLTKDRIVEDLIGNIIGIQSAVHGHYLHEHR